ncbi:MAG TPA: Calx-beta domain-containing protein [Pyrinomonadaceae bacterium]|jgi:hypothetical protein
MEIDKDMSYPKSYVVRASLRIVLSLAVVAFLGWLTLPASVWNRLEPKAEAAQQFTVTTTDDNGDNVNPTPGSLRKAIIDANATPGTDTIAFQIGSGLQTIKPKSELPATTDPVIIDGTTQPGFAGVPLIFLDGSDAGEVGGLRISGGNSTVRGLIISSFRYRAIQIDNLGNNLIAGNYIGTNATGTAASGTKENNGPGILIFSANNIIGGITPADRNIVSGNTNSNGSIGVWMWNAGATGNKVIGNYIGTDVTGTVAIGQGNVGVWITNDASFNIIGGSTAAERNVISANASGVSMDSTPHHNKVQGNYIGTKADGTGNLGNGYGVILERGSHDNLVGGTNPGEGNVIANSNGQGVAFFSDNSADTVNNAILGNSIYSNQQLGIDFYLDGVTPNDVGATVNDPSDADVGPNNLQNFPDITSVANVAANTVIDGTLRSEASKTYRIELFSNTTCDPSGYGEGERFVASTNATTNASGNINFNFTIPTASITGLFFTVTATDPNNNTSEFSQCKSNAAATAGTLQFGATFLNVNESAGTVNAVVTRTGGSTGAVSVTYTTSDGTANAPADYTAKTGQIDFADGETSKQVSINIANDSVSENTETFLITLSNPTNSASLGAQSQVTIFIDDNDAPTISINDVQVAEGNAGTTNATFTVSLSAAYFKTTSVDFATAAGGTATSGNDYQPTMGTVTFGIGETSKPVTVLVNGDPTQEPNETFLVKLSNNTDLSINKGTGTGTILDDDAPTNTLAFSKATYGVQENQQTADIIVNRSGNLSSAVTVDYLTSDNSGLIPCQTNNNGIASERCDYATAAGTLRFAAGETTKTIQIPIVNDAYVEPNESFTIKISNPKGGAGLGATITATITITSDDAQLAVNNPIDNQAFFIRMQYIDFLGRIAEPAGFDFWMNRMTNCPPGDICDRIDTAKRFFESDEFKERGFYLYKLYDGVLGRQPKYAEFIPEVARLNGSQTPQEQQLNKDAFLLEFINRAEFKTIYGQYLAANGLTATDAAGFVNALCAKAGVTPASKQTLITNLQNATKSPAKTVEDFILTPEMNVVGTPLYDRGIITMQYFGFVRRDPDAGGFTFWQGQLMNQNSVHYHDYRFMIGGFINSDEYRFRFALLSVGP